MKRSAPVLSEFLADKKTPVCHQIEKILNDVDQPLTAKAIGDALSAHKRSPLGHEYTITYDIYNAAAAMTRRGVLEKSKLAGRTTFSLVGELKMRGEEYVPAFVRNPPRRGGDKRKYDGFGEIKDH